MISLDESIQYYTRIVQEGVNIRYLYSLFNLLRAFSLLHGKVSNNRILTDGLEEAYLPCI